MVGREDERARLKALLDAAREGPQRRPAAARPGRDRQDRAAALGDRPRPTDFRSCGRAGWSRSPTSRSPGSPSSSRRCWGSSTRSRASRRRRCAARSRSARRRPPTASPCPPRCSRCSPAAEDRPVLAVIDDAQWLDEPSLEAFLFAGRRLEQEGVAMLGARPRRRGGSRCRGWSGCAIAPLPRRGRSRAARRGDRAGRRRPAGGDRRRQPARAAGDPGAAVGRRSSPGASRWRTRCGRGPASSARSPSRSRRCRSATRRALLVAAAAGTRRLDAIGRGLRSRPVARDLEPAEAARIVALADGELEFRHPLLRSTVYHARVAARAARGARGAGRARRRGRRARVAPRGVRGRAGRGRSRRRSSAAALDARGRGAHATAARDLGRAAQLTPDGRAARPPPARGGRRRGPLRRWPSARSGCSTRRRR